MIVPLTEKKIQLGIKNSAKHLGSFSEKNGNAWLCS